MRSQRTSCATLGNSFVSRWPAVAVAVGRLAHGLHLLLGLHEALLQDPPTHSGLVAEAVERQTVLREEPGAAFHADEALQPPAARLIVQPATTHLLSFSSSSPLRLSPQVRLLLEMSAAVEANGVLPVQPLVPLAQVVAEALEPANEVVFQTKEAPINAVRRFHVLITVGFAHEAHFTYQTNKSARHFMALLVQFQLLLCTKHISAALITRNEINLLASSTQKTTKRAVTHGAGEFNSPIVRQKHIRHSKLAYVDVFSARGWV